MTVTTGFSFPPGGPLATHAARTFSLAYDASGNIAMANYAATGVGGVLAYTPPLTGNPSLGAWLQEAGSASNLNTYLVDPSGTYVVDPQGNVISLTISLSQAIAVANGYVLDATSGLYAWGNGAPLLEGSPPYVAMASGAYGLYVTSPTTLYTSGGIPVAGVATSGVFSLFASGSSFWHLAATEAWQSSLTSSGAATITSFSLPLTATCMGASGSSLVIGGYVPYSLPTDAFAVAVSPNGSGFVSFPGSGYSYAYILSGQPASWSILATNTGLPNYSSAVVAAWAPNQNQILLSDYGSGHWAAYSYTAGVMALLSSGAVSGISRGLAISSDSQYAIIPNPAASGFSLLGASGVGWASSGLVTGGLPGASSVAWVSGDSFAIGSSGQVGILGAIAGVWTYTSSIPLPFTPAAIAYDQNAALAWCTSSGSVASVNWIGSVTGVLASGSLSSGAGTPASLVIQRNQLAIGQASPSGQIVVVGQPTPGVLSVKSISPLSGLTLIAGPLSDASILAATPGSMTFFSYTAPYVLSQAISGVYATIAGGVLTGASGLGYQKVPSALGLDLSGQVLLATTYGQIGQLASGFPSATQALASGGFSYILTP